MSQENIPHVSRERFQALLDAMNARDFEAVATLIGSEITFRSALGRAEGADPYSGIDGLRRWASDVDAVWEDWHQEIVDFRQLGDRKALIVVRATGKAKASGVPLDSLTGNLLTWERDKGWQLAAFSDPREALEAAGLSE
jgi:SnoaL-like protein